MTKLDKSVHSERIRIVSVTVWALMFLANTIMTLGSVILLFLLAQTRWGSMQTTFLPLALMNIMSTGAAWFLLWRYLRSIVVPQLFFDISSANQRRFVMRRAVQLMSWTIGMMIVSMFSWILITVVQITFSRLAY